MADALTVCNKLTSNVKTRACLPSGGIKNRCWIGQVADRGDAYTYKANGALSSFVLTDDATFITAYGRAQKGSGASALTKPEDGGLSNEQTVVIEVAYGTQHEATALETLLRADAKFVLIETNAGTIRGYFWEFGDVSAAAEEGTGLKLADANGILKITLKGSETGLPIFFEAANASTVITQLQASRNYLDALVTGAEVID